MKVNVSQINLFETVAVSNSKMQATEFCEILTNFAEFGNSTIVEQKHIGNGLLPIYLNEFWTAKQRQSDSIHEISYRACFKAQLPRFFIESLTKVNDIVYDPFAGRGTTIIEAALLGRHVVANDVNPLSKILCKPRLSVPNLNDIWNRLNEIPIEENIKADLDLSMFFHPQTEAEIVSLKNYLQSKYSQGNDDLIDDWIRMVATNRLTGHSSGFFSVYTLPPNQAVKPERQKKINETRNQTPDYRNTKEIILKKSKSLMRDLSQSDKENLRNISKGAIFSTSDARFTNRIPSDLVQLTVTSPPFLDVVQYADDNWLRCWFNSIDIENVEISITKTVEKWCEIMSDVFKELYRITLKAGFVAFEVGEIKNGKIKLDEYVVSLGEEAGFHCEGIIINEQIFTKTSNIWGIKNNDKGTNSNRIVLFRKK